MKKDLLTKMLMIGGAGFGSLIVTIALIWAMSGEKTGKPKNNQNHTIPQEMTGDSSSPVLDSLDGERFFALVRMPVAEDGILPVYDLDRKKELLLKIKGETSIKSRYGEPIAAAQVRPGHIVEGKYEAESFAVYAVQISGRAWEKKDPAGLVISAEQKKIGIGSDEYTYDPDFLMVLKNGKAITLAEVSASDEVIVRGYKKEVWSVEVTAGHGFLTLKNADAFTGGTIEIGNRDIRTIEKDMRIELSAGVKRIIISKDNMNPYANDVFIEEGKEAVIDLGEFKPKVGKVTFSTVQDGVTLYIDEEKQALANAEVTLDFGQHKLKAEKDGYVPWESTLTVNQVVMQVKIDMKVEPQYLDVQTPLGAELYIDGARVGVIPVRTAITPGEHTLSIRKEGYYSKNQAITVENNGKNVNYAFPDLIRIGSNETEQPNNGLSPTAPNVTTPPTPANPNLKLNPTEDNY